MHSSRDDSVLTALPSHWTLSLSNPRRVLACSPSRSAQDSVNVLSSARDDPHHRAARAELYSAHGGRLPPLCLAFGDQSPVSRVWPPPRGQLRRGSPLSRIFWSGIDWLELELQRLEGDKMRSRCFCAGSCTRWRAGSGFKRNTPLKTQPGVYVCEWEKAKEREREKVGRVKKQRLCIDSRSVSQTIDFWDEDKRRACPRESCDIMIQAAWWLD